MPVASFIRGFRKADVRPAKAGASIRDIVLEYNPETGDWQGPTVCHLNDAPVLRKDWASTLLAEGDNLTFTELPRGGGGGGGSNPLQIIFSVVLIAAAVLIPPLLGPAFAAGTLGGALLSGAIMAVGGLLMGLLFKTPALPQGHSANIEQADPTYSPIISRNRARLFEVIGENFGRIQIVPDLVANAWAYYIGNQAWSYQVFGLGLGEHELESLAFGDTVIWRADSGMTAGYEIEIQHLGPGRAVSLFPDNVETSIEVGGQEIFPPNHAEYNGSIGPHSANPPGTVTTRIVNNIVFSRGGGRYDDQGNLQALSFHLVIQAQRIDDFGQAMGEWFNLFSGALTYRTMTPQRISIDEAVPEGRYQVRVYRTDRPPLDGRTMWTIQWESLFSFLPGTLRYNQSVVAMRIKSSNILTQQAASSLKATLTRKLPLYDLQTKTWSEPVPTRKLAAALSWVLKAEWGGNLPDRLIDLDTLWGDIDRTMEEKDWTFDGRFSGDSTVWARVMEMCQPFRLVPRIAGGVATFIYDRPGRPVRHIFTPRNVVRGSLTITYNTFGEDTPDDIMGSYLDEAAGFAQREVRSALPDSESRNPAVRSDIGIVKRKHRFQAGNFMANCNRKRRIAAKFQTEAIGRLILMGDVIAMNHPFYSNLASGEITGWNEESLSFDLGVELAEPQETVYLALTQPDGSPWGPCQISAVIGSEVFLARADYELIRSQGQNNPFYWVDFGQGRAATIWTVQAGKEFSGRMLVQSVAPVDRWHWEITAINDAPDTDEYDDLPVPPWEWRGQEVESAPPLGAPSGLTAEGLGTPEAPIIGFRWSPIASARSYRIEESVGPALWGMERDVPTNAAQIEVSPGYVSFRVAALDSEGRPGPWSRWSGDTDSLYPPAPIITDSSFEGGVAWMSWEAPPEATGSDAPAAWILTLLSPDGFSVIQREELRPDIFELACETGLDVLNIELRFRTFQGRLSRAANLTLIEG